MEEIRQDALTSEVYYNFPHCHPLFVPAEPREKLLNTVHGDALMGQMGAHKFLEKLNDKFRWLNMKADINMFIKKCSTCQFFNSSNKKPAGLLQSLPVSHIFHTLAIDFVGGFPETTGIKLIYTGR